MNDARKKELLEFAEGLVEDIRKKIEDLKGTLTEEEAILSYVQQKTLGMYWNTFNANDMLRSALIRGEKELPQG